MDKFTGRGPLFSGARQLVIGLLAAAVTYGIGHLIGVTIDQFFARRRKA